VNTTADEVLDNCAHEIRPLARAIFTELHTLFPDAVITADADSIGLGTGPGYNQDLRISSVAPASWWLAADRRDLLPAAGDLRLRGPRSRSTKTYRPAVVPAGGDC
jgi:hypothetical protein